MVTEIVDAFIGAITGILSGIGTGILDVFGVLIYNATDGLSDLAVWMLAFMGISFALTIFYALFKKVA